MAVVEDLIESERGMNEPTSLPVGSPLVFFSPPTLSTLIHSFKFTLLSCCYFTFLGPLRVPQIKKPTTSATRKNLVVLVMMMMMSTATTNIERGGGGGGGGAVGSKGRRLVGWEILMTLTAI